MEEYRVVKKIELSKKNKPTGNTKHFQGNQIINNIRKLLIVKYPEEQGFYLLYLDSDDNELTDTYHDNLESAFEQASWEFNVSKGDWV